MIFNRKKKEIAENKQFYTLVILTREEMDEEEYDRLHDMISEQVDNIGVGSNLARNELELQDLIAIDEKVKIEANPCFILIAINNDHITREIKLMEQQHKWKKFLGYLTPLDYLRAADRAHFNWQAIVFFADNPEEIIHYLNNN